MDQKGPDIGRTNFKGCIIYPAVQATRAKCWYRVGEGGNLSTVVKLSTKLIRSTLLRWTGDKTAAVTSLERTI